MNNLGTVLWARADELADVHQLEPNRQEAIMTEAEKHFYDAIRSHPHHVHAHYNLAVLHMYGSVHIILL